MPIIIGRNISERSYDKFADIVWLNTAPTVVRSSYPIIFDIIESAYHAHQNRLISLVYETLAPQYEQITRNKVRNELEPNEVPFNRTFENEIRAGLLEFIRSLDSNYGVAFHNPEFYDYDSYKLMILILNTTKSLDINIAINTSADIKNYIDLTRDQKITVVKSDKKKFMPSIKDLKEPRIRLLSQCPNGLPESILDKLGYDRDGNVILSSMGPNNLPWVSLPSTYYRISNRILSKSQKQNLNTVIFDNWEPDGWNYVRRAHSALLSGDLERILSQHRIYTQTMQSVNDYFLYSYFLGLTSLLDKKVNKANYLNANVSVARLARRIQSKQGTGNKWYERSLNYYERSIRLTDDIVRKIELMWELANTYPIIKDPLNLNKSRNLCATATRLLNDNKDKFSKKEFISQRVLLENISALVEYLDGNSDDALILEEQAKYLIEINQIAFPELSSLLVLIKYNLAQLHAKRYSNKSLAIKLLDECINSGSVNPETQLSARMYLSELYFDSGNYAAVIDLLKDLFEVDKFWNLTNQFIFETFHRTIFIISLLLNQERDRALFQLNLLSSIASSRNMLTLQRLITNISSSYKLNIKKQ